MTDEAFNMSMRQFLKRVGVSSQRAIEEAVREARASGALQGRDTITATMTLTIDGLEIDHTVTGDIVVKDET